MSEMVVEVVRSGFVESVHRARVHVVGADGAPVMVCGDTSSLASPRSAMKPLQALAMVRAGLPLENELLALAAASHSGEPFHIDGVRKILAGAGWTRPTCVARRTCPSTRRRATGFCGSTATPAGS